MSRRIVAMMAAEQDYSMHVLTGEVRCQFVGAGAPAAVQVVVPPLPMVASAAESANLFRCRR